MSPLTQSQLAELERMLDQTCLAALLGEIATLCFAKASHVAETYNDVALADAWSKAGVVVDKAGMRTAVHMVTP